MMSSNAMEADQGIVKSHLRHITRRWGELGIACVFEIRLLTADDRAVVKFVARYAPDEAGLDMAADQIVGMNQHKLNAYVVVNPIDARADIKAGKAASDDDIVASFFHWADADNKKAAENIKSFVGPRPTFFVLTGTHPSSRPHVYWELEEPTFNKDAWTAIQRRIAATLETDSSVINPSRIMRIAGTVNWPKPMKQAKGYTQEVTKLRLYDEDERPRVSSERMARAFTGAALPPAAEKTLTIDTGEHYGRSVDEFQEILRRARTDGEKHGGVRDLAASLAGQGVSRSLTEAIIRDVCPVHDENVVNLIDTAYAKFYTPQGAPNFDHPPASAEAPSWRLQQVAEFIKDFVAPEYLIDGVIQRGRLYTFTAPTGSGKTAVMLHIGISISRGKPIGERETEPGDVIYMAGENPDDVRARIIATMAAEGIDPATCRLHFIPGTFSIRHDMALLHEAIAQLPNVVLVVVDTLAAYFDGDDSNSNAQMLDFARVLRALTTAKSKPAVIVPAHPVKNAAKNNLTPMGGSALLNEVDGNLCLWKRDAAVEMHWQGKHRGAEFDPLSFELKNVESDKVRDSKGRLMPTVMAVPLLEIRAIEIATRAVKMEDKLLLNIEAYDAQSIRQRCVDIGLVNGAGVAKKSSCIKMLEKLESEKLISRIRSNWRLTTKGEEAVRIIKNGGSIVDPDL